MAAKVDNVTMYALRFACSLRWQTFHASIATCRITMSVCWTTAWSITFSVFSNQEPSSTERQSLKHFLSQEGLTMLTNTSTPLNWLVKMMFHHGLLSRPLTVFRYVQVYIVSGSAWYNCGVHFIQYVFSTECVQVFCHTWSRIHTSILLVCDAHATCNSRNVFRNVH